MGGGLNIAATIRKTDWYEPLNVKYIVHLVEDVYTTHTLTHTVHRNKNEGGLDLATTTKLKNKVYTARSMKDGSRV